jgi:hypothetical protein
MENFSEHARLPNPERLSLLAATILLAIALGRFIRLPVIDLSTQLPGFYLSLRISAQVFVAFIVAGLTAAGVDWLLRDHPAMRRGRRMEHWLLPGLTALTLGVPLFQMPLSPLWWLGFAVSGAVLMLVLLAEYIIVDPQDVRRPLASIGLTAVAFTLYLVLIAGLRFAELRLFLITPAAGLACGLIGLRVLRLRLDDHWAILEAGLCALITMQLAAALHYWPISPVTYALTLLGPGYALTTFFGNLAAGENPRQAAVEPAVLMTLIWAAAVWLR